MSTCRKCDGAKTVLIDDVEVERPACNGTGEAEYYNEPNESSEGDPTKEEA